MNDLKKSNIVLVLQIEHLKNRIFMHQSNYNKKVLKNFNMNKVSPLNFPRIVRSLNIELKGIHFVLAKKMKKSLILKYHS